jgi:hypothetical protein
MHKHQYFINCSITSRGFYESFLILL